MTHSGKSENCDEEDVLGILNEEENSVENFKKGEWKDENGRRLN